MNPFVKALATVQEAERLRLAGKLDRAQTVCATLLREYPDYVAALQTMGLILADRSQDQQALGYLHRASMLDPNNPMILTALAGVYLSMGAHLMAARTLEQARWIAPEDANILATLGEVYRANKEYELAKEAYEASLKIDPTFEAAEIGLVQSLVQIGQLVDASRIIEKKIRDGSRSITVLHQLSHFPASMVSLDAIALLDEFAPPATKGNKQNDELLAQHAFTRAAALDRAGRHDEAWDELKQARRYNMAENRRRYRDERQFHASLLQLARTTRLPAPVADTAEHPISLFIVGPSRSGKTTLEQLVGLLPDVKRGHENPIVENAVRSSFQSAGFPTRIDLVSLPTQLGDTFRRSYFDEFRKRAGDARVLTNTLPARNEDAVRVAAEIPNARFIFIMRDIDDVSLRIYMRLYKGGNVHSSDLRDTREHVVFCHQMIDVMAERMPEISRTVTYEELVADPAAALNTAAELCGLDPYQGALPPVGDDRGCAAPYRERMEAALRATD